MPRYYFNVNDKEKYRDEIGVELPDLDTARQEALGHFGERLQSCARDFADDEVWNVTVADERGVELLKFTFFMDRSSMTMASEDPPTVRND